MSIGPRFRVGDDGYHDNESVLNEVFAGFGETARWIPVTG